MTTYLITSENEPKQLSLMVARAACVAVEYAAETAGKNKSAPVETPQSSDPESTGRT